MPHSILRDNKGSIASTEFFAIVTISVLAMIVGWSEVAIALNSELTQTGSVMNVLNLDDTDWVDERRGGVRSGQLGGQGIESPDDAGEQQNSDSHNDLAYRQQFRPLSEL